MNHTPIQQHLRRPRPSDTLVPPGAVTDVLLWRLAVDVAAAHHRTATDGCVNLRCTGQRGTCAAGRLAQHALRAAARPVRRHPSTVLPVTTGSPARPATQPAIPAAIPAATSPAVGRAAVPGGYQVAGWFTTGGQRPAEVYRAKSPVHLRRLAA